MRFQQIWCSWDFVLHHSKDPNLYHSVSGHFTVQGLDLIAECHRNRGHTPSVEPHHIVRLERYGDSGWFNIMLEE